MTKLSKYLSTALYAIAPNLLSANDTVQLDWTITRFLASYDGVQRSVIGINGQSTSNFTVRVKCGSRVIIKTTSDVEEGVAIHWHGMFQKTTQEMDGVGGVTQCPLTSKKTIVYDFLAIPCGTHWFHAHLKTEYMDGLRGAFIVEDSPHENKVVADEDYVLQMADYYHEESASLFQKATDISLNPTGAKPVWNTVLINDRGRIDCTKVDKTLFPVCNKQQPLTTIIFETGKTYRLRLINMGGFAPLNFSVDNHEMTVVAADGVRVKPSRKVNSVRLFVAQTMDVLIEAVGEANQQYFMRSKSNFGPPYTSLPREKFPADFNPVGLGRVVYGEKAVTPCDPKSKDWKTIDTLENDVDLVSLIPVIFPKDAQQNCSILQFTIKTTPSDPNWLGYVSVDQSPFTTFVLPTLPTLYALALGREIPVSSNPLFLASAEMVQTIFIYNLNPAVHPMHLHGFIFRILFVGNVPIDKIGSSCGKGTPVPPSRYKESIIERDVASVTGCTPDNLGNCQDAGLLVIQFYTDNPGAWLLHCHIEWHFATGFTSTVIVDEKQFSQNPKGLGVFDEGLVGTCGEEPTYRP
uniref:Multicopper oxidase putative n=1 Tax=Albugo laibachii Nc14 TaxID=890382 RepID=F0WGD2_9STRA|nr:multicopper oxidase putative [Albugo laibachii Nc14]|eukprot:CCA20293.1 multicopper oxidase putative [Albugo laibachii Nc14]